MKRHPLHLRPTSISGTFQYSFLSEEEDEEDDKLGTEQPSQSTLPTRKRFLRKSVISDWGINFEELVIGKKIGDGRTGQVIAR